MGDISVNKLAGLSLIVGPVVALVFYFIQQFGVIGNGTDPADGSAVVQKLAGSAELSVLTAIGITIGVIILFHGVARLTQESGDALSSLGLKFIIVGTAGWVVGNGITASIAGDISNGGLYGAALGINQFSAIVFSLGFAAINLGIAGRDYINKNVAYVVAIVALVGLVTAVIGGFDSTTLQTMNLIGGIVYIIWTLWSIWLGKDMMARD